MRFGRVEPAAVCCSAAAGGVVGKVHCGSVGEVAMRVGESKGPFTARRKPKNATPLWPFALKCRPFGLASHGPLIGLECTGCMPFRLGGQAQSVCLSVRKMNLKDVQVRGRAGESQLETLARYGKEMDVPG